MVHKSLAQIKAEARARAAQLEARAKQAARDLDQHMKHRIDAMTGHGQRPLSKAELERLGREGADYLRRRLR